MPHTCLFHISGNHYPAFPGNHHTRRIWDELAKGFDEYHVIARGIGHRYTHSIDGNIHLHLLPAFGKQMWPFFFLSWCLPWFVWRHRPTHLLSQCPVMGGLAAAFCAKVFRIPLFVELHGSHYFAPAKPGWKGILEHAVYRMLSRPCLHAALRVRSLSEDMSEHIDRVYGKAVSEKIVVIPNRVDLETFQHKKASYALTGPLKIISVGRFSVLKNHRALIEDLANASADFHLTLVGSGPLRDEYLKLAQRLQASSRITIREDLDHQALATLLPQQDIYIHYALSEGVPRAILEAMAAGLPVVATRVGYIKGVLLDGENALVIDKPYAPAMQQVVRQLADSEPLRQHLGTAARQTIEDRFEWHRVFDLYRAAIKDMGQAVKSCAY